MPSKWIRVSRKAPCLICQKPDYCTRTEDGKLARCMRVESARPSKIQGGWIHDINGQPVPAPREPKRVADVPGLARKMFKDKLADAKRIEVSKRLGVSLESLVLLRVGIGWDHDGQEFASFPSRGATGTVIGITRRYGDGTKKTFPGTRNGVFVAEGWWTRTGPVCIVEGASDAAALVTHGFCAIGRPSNIGGADIIRAFLGRRAKGRPVVVIGENDRKPDRVGQQSQCKSGCAGCAWCWPGRYGAIKVANELGAKWGMVPKDCKDVRDWSRKKNFAAVLHWWLSWLVNRSGTR